MYPGTWAATTPDKPALIMAGSGETLTYAELDDRSLRLANHLRLAGLDTGDVVAMISDNRPETYEVYWAALRSGLYITAVNNHLSATEASYIVNDCGARALIVSGALAATATALDVDVAERLSFGGEVEGYADYEGALAAAGNAPLPEQRHGDDMLYSSGTTGRPKGIKPPAFVKPADGAHGTGDPQAEEALAAELTSYAREQIAHFKVPREFHFRDELPRTPTGKMVKGKLREEYLTS